MGCRQRSVATAALDSGRAVGRRRGRTRPLLWGKTASVVDTYFAAKGISSEWHGIEGEKETRAATAALALAKWRQTYQHAVTLLT